MAKKSKVISNQKKAAIVERARAKRTALRAKAKDANLSPEERASARLALQNMPRNTAETRLRNRCEITGRPRAYLRKFKMSRLAFREAANLGLLPGVTKASW